MPPFVHTRRILTETGARAPAGQGAMPIPPESITSATLTEYFVADADSVFSDTGGTTPAVLGGPVALVKARAGRSETLTQATGANQPEWDIETRTQQPSLVGNGTSTFMNRSYKGNVGTALMVYALDPRGVASRGNQCILSAPGPTTDSYSIFPFVVFSSTDGVLYQELRSDASYTRSWASAVMGPADVLMTRTDGSAYQIARSGKTCSTSPISGTGTRVNAGGANACLMGFMAFNGTVNQWVRGNVIALVTFSGKVSDAEMPGLMQWGMDLARQAWPGKYLGAFFNADGFSENSANTNATLVHSNDLINWNFRPSNGLPRNFGNTGIGGRDYGIAADASGNVYMVNTTSAGTSFDLSKCTDGFNFTFLKTITTSVTGVSAVSWAPEFVKNQDGTMYLDGSGLPTIVFGASSSGSGSLKIYTIKPTNTTWTTGGTWGTAALITGTQNTTEIDPSVMLVGTTFHMFTAGQGTNTSLIYYRTATSLTGTWTLQSNPVIPAGFEAPQPIWLGGNNYMLQLDFQGLGYFYCLSTTGIAGPWSRPAAVNAPFIAEQGSFTPMPTGWSGYGTPKFNPPALGSFMPTDLSGLTAWWDAGTLATPSVSSWLDRVSGKNLVQATTASQPGWGANSFNGMPGVTFISAVLQESTLNPFDGAFHIFIVCSTVTTAYAALLSADSAGVAGMPALGFQPNKNLDLQRTGQADTGSTTLIHPGWQGAIMEFSSAAGLSGGSITATPVLDGVSGTALTVTTYAAAHSGIRVGQNSVGGDKFTGVIAQIAIFNRVLTSTEADKMRGFLARKGNLVASQPSASAYKTVAP